MKTISIGAVGDVLPHSNVLKRALSGSSGIYSFGKMLTPCASFFSNVDISIINQESIVAGEKFGISSFPKFNAPVSILSDLKKLNIDVLNVANNHLLDKGEEALKESIANIKDFGFGVIGAYEKGDSNGGALLLEKNGIKVKFISYTDGSKLNLDVVGGLNVNYFKGESYSLRMNRRISSIKKDILNAQKESDAVVLSLHFGEEYHRQPNSFQREMISSIAETGVDVIIGHHPHVLQPIEWVQNSKGKNVLVAYSLGNFFTGQLGLYRQVGGFLSFEIKKDKNKVSICYPKLKFTFVDVYNGCKVKPLKSFYERGEGLKTGKSEYFCAESTFNDLLGLMSCKYNPFVREEQVITFE
ncbi:CapA family protein [Halomonas sp. AOP42-C2-25]|uniref:CapA family protein n=1 Tax=Halomonas sp. AOP42-C2-25 TaxID=3457668 RepID=UPI004033299B